MMLDSAPENGSGAGRERTRRDGLLAREGRGNADAGRRAGPLGRERVAGLALARLPRFAPPMTGSGVHDSASPAQGSARSCEGLDR